jgi:hypothetical protein
MELKPETPVPVVQEIYKIAFGEHDATAWGTDKNTFPPYLAGRSSEYVGIIGHQFLASPSPSYGYAA